ncbi:MAG: metallophosphoesterase [Deferribacterales bacterium]
MKIGVISDSHDNLVVVEKVVEMFNHKKIDFLFHLGDICSPFTVKLLNKLACGYIGVFGNNDGEWIGINRISDGKFFKPPHLVEMFGKRFILFHEGDIKDYISSEIDFVLYGHTHFHEIKRNGSQWIINPGSLAGYLSGKSTYAILDIEKDLCEVFEI